MSEFPWDAERWADLEKQYREDAEREIASLVNLVSDLRDALIEKDGGMYRCIACDTEHHEDWPPGSYHQAGCVVRDAEVLLAARKVRGSTRQP